MQTVRQRLGARIGATARNNLRHASVRDNQKWTDALWGFCFLEVTDSLRYPASGFPVRVCKRTDLNGERMIKFSSATDFIFLKDDHDRTEHASNHSLLMAMPALIMWAGTLATSYFRLNHIVELTGSSGELSNTHPTAKALISKHRTRSKSCIRTQGPRFVLQDTQ